MKSSTYDRRAHVIWVCRVHKTQREAEMWPLLCSSVGGYMFLWCSSTHSFSPYSSLVSWNWRYRETLMQYQGKPVGAVFTNVQLILGSLSFFYDFSTLWCTSFLYHTNDTTLSQTSVSLRLCNNTWTLAYIKHFNNKVMMKNIQVICPIWFTKRSGANLTIFICFSLGFWCYWVEHVIVLLCEARSLRKTRT